MQKGILDRFEGDFAIIEMNDQTIDVPKTKLPKDINIGDQVIIDGENIALDLEGTRKLRTEIDHLANELFEE